MTSVYGLIFVLVVVVKLVVKNVSSKESVPSAKENGRTAGTSVWCLKGTTLKGIRTAMP